MSDLPLKHRIDLAAYPRADIFRAFVHRQMPQISVTSEVDITSLHLRCEAMGVPFFMALSHAVSCAVNAVPQFRHRVIDGELYEYERTDPNYTVAREGDLFSFCDGLHVEDFGGYRREAEARMAAVKAKPDLTVAARHHLFFITSLPWLHFTAVTHPYEPLYAYIPVITLGKFVKRGDAVVMPVAVQVHHGVVDGVHIARFYEALETRAASAVEWLK